jgi:spermidine/putrescine transport system ATP-binding protein
VRTVQLDGMEDRRPAQLSGGQQQRVALARALVNRPAALLLDEPLGALDLKLRKEMQLELKALQREVGITFVYVTHDQEEALTMSDVIVVMRDGRIQQMGDPTELYERPRNRFVADFIGTSNFMIGTIASSDGGDLVTVTSERGLTLHGRVTDRSAVPAVGDAVTVVIRPERIEVAPGDASAATGWTSVSGRIHQGTYLGDQTEYRVQTDQAGELIVRLQNTMGASIGQSLGPGDPVIVRWREEANLVLVA